MHREGIVGNTPAMPILRLQARLGAYHDDRRRGHNDRVGMVVITPRRGHDTTGERQYAQGDQNLDDAFHVPDS